MSASRISILSCKNFLGRTNPGNQVIINIKRNDLYIIDLV